MIKTLNPLILLLLLIAGCSSNRKHGVAMSDTLQATKTECVSKLKGISWADTARDAYKDENSARKCLYCAMIYIERKQFEKAMLFLKHGESIAQEFDDNRLLAKIYENLCVVNLDCNSNELGYEYAKQFLNTALVLGNREYLARAYNYMYVVLMRKGEKEAAKLYLDKCKAYIDTIGNPTLLLSNIGFYYLRQKDYDTARTFLLRSNQIERHNYTTWALANIFLHEGDYDRAEELYEEAILTNSDILKVAIMKDYASLLFSTGREADAAMMWKDISLLSDTLNKRSNDVKEIQMDYEHSETVEGYADRISFFLKVLFLLFTFMVGLILFHVFSKKRMYSIIYSKQKELHDKENEFSSQIALNQQAIETLEHKNEDSVAALDSLQESMEQHLGMTFKQLGRGKIIYDKLVNRNYDKGDFQTNVDSLIKYFSVAEYKIYTQWERIRGRNKLQKSQYVYLILWHIGYTDEEVQTLMRVKQGSIRAVKSKLKKLGFNDVVKTQKKTVK